MKEIIIDGVDISKCEYSYKDNMCMDDTNNGYCIKEDCQIYNLFKQLQQKEKENEGLQEQIFIYDTDLNLLKEKYANKEKEIEELKEKIKTLDDAVITYELTESDFKKYNKLKQAINKIKGMILGSDPDFIVREAIIDIINEVEE